MKKSILLLFVSLLGLVSQASETRFNPNSLGFWNSSNADYHVSPVNVSSLEQYKEILSMGCPCVVFFWAEWCGPCRIVRPQVDKLADEHKNIIFLTVNVDQVPAIPTECEIYQVPTMLFLDEAGKEVDRVIGVKSIQTYEECIMKINNK